MARLSLPDPTKLAYYFVFALESVTLSLVVRAAGSWCSCIDECSYVT